MTMPDGVDLRCSAVVFRRQAVLLVYRTYNGGDWVLPGGTPQPGESTAACVRREVREETGLVVSPDRVAFVLEVVGPEPGPRTLDIVFAATEAASNAQPEAREPGLEPLFVPVDQVSRVDLRPPLAGYLRSLLGQGSQRYAPYLANMWRPVSGDRGRRR